jgi:hypothetical protein
MSAFACLRNLTWRPREICEPWATSGTDTKSESLSHCLQVACEAPIATAASALRRKRYSSCDADLRVPILEFASSVVACGSSRFSI